MTAITGQHFTKSFAQVVANVSRGLDEDQTAVLADLADLSSTALNATSLRLEESP